MRILLTLLLLSAPSLAVPPRHRSFRELVAERGLVVSEACLADTQTLRQNEALATALANSQAEASNAIMNSCQANGNNLICQADIEASVATSDEFKAACEAAGGVYNTTSFAFTCSGDADGQSINIQFTIDNDFTCFAPVCNYTEIVEEMQANFQEGILAVVSQYPGLQCSSSVNGESGGVALGRVALALAAVAASAVWVVMV